MDLTEDEFYISAVDFLSNISLDYTERSSSENKLKTVKQIEETTKENSITEIKQSDKNEKIYIFNYDLPIWMFCLRIKKKQLDFVLARCFKSRAFSNDSSNSSSTHSTTAAFSLGNLDLNAQQQQPQQQQPSQQQNFQLSANSVIQSAYTHQNFQPDCSVSQSHSDVTAFFSPNLQRKFVFTPSSISESRLRFPFVISSLIPYTAAASVVANPVSSVVAAAALPAALHNKSVFGESFKMSAGGNSRRLNHLTSETTEAQNQQLQQHHEFAPNQRIRLISGSGGGVAAGAFGNNSSLASSSASATAMQGVGGAGVAASSMGVVVCGGIGGITATANTSNHWSETVSSFGVLEASLSSGGGKDISYSHLLAVNRQRHDTHRKRQRESKRREREKANAAMRYAQNSKVGRGKSHRARVSRLKLTDSEQSTGIGSYKFERIKSMEVNQKQCSDATAELERDNELPGRGEGYRSTENFFSNTVDLSSNQKLANFGKSFEQLTTKGEQSCGDGDNDATNEDDDDDTCDVADDDVGNDVEDDELFEAVQIDQTEQVCHDDDELERLQDEISEQYGVAYRTAMFDNTNYSTKLHSVVMRRPGVLSSLIRYAKPADQKAAMNQQFQNFYPRIQLSLSKLRSLRLAMIAIGQKTEQQLAALTGEQNFVAHHWFIAHALVLFERLVLKKLVTKSNRRLCCCACMLLSAKLNDVRMAQLKALLSELENGFRQTRHDICQFELVVLIGLEFDLSCADHHVAWHLQRMQLETDFPAD